MHLSALWEYPVKSCQSRALSSARITPEGFINDRRFLLVTPKGRFVTQREFPQMVKIKAWFDNDQLTFEIAGQQQAIGRANFNEAMDVVIWNDQVSARLSSEAPALVSDFLGIEVLLVELPAKNRPISDASADGHVSFADGLPYLLTTTGSLADLNSRLDKPVPMLNFRPNLVVESAEAFAEDKWSRLKIGELVFKAVKPCSRCIMTTVNIESGIPATTMEPLKTLASYRSVPGEGVMFGMNLVAENNGWVHVEDPVEILEE